MASSIAAGISFDAQGNAVVPPAGPTGAQVANLETAALPGSKPIPTSTGVQDGPPAPYTPAAVAAATKNVSNNPSNANGMSGSAMAMGGVSTGNAITSASKTLTTPAGTFTYNGQQYNSSQLPPGMTTQPPEGVPYSTVSTSNGPVYVASTFGTGSGQPPATLPQGYKASTPDNQGNISYTNAQGQVVATLPAGSTNTGSVLNSVSNVESALGDGYTVTASADGNSTVTGPGGQSYTLGASTMSSPSAIATAVQGISGKTQADAAATETANAQIQAINNQLNQTLQQLSQQQDAATGEAGAGTGGFGKMAETGASTRYAQLIQNAKDDAQSQIAQINAGLDSAKSTNTSNLTSQLEQIEQTAQSTTISLANQAQSNFLNTTKTFDTSTLQLPQGQSLSNLTVGGNGSTGVPAVDALIQQGVQAGYTPQAALQLVQAGVATQNKNNQAQFLGLLQQASYTNGWATATPDQLKADPLFNAYVGMAQSYIPSLNNNPAAAQALVAGGTVAQQKMATTATGSPTGATNNVPVNALPPSASMTDEQANTPGVAGSIADGTAYTPNGIYQSAIQYALDGKTPPMGLGTAPQVQKARAAVVDTAGAIAAAAGVTLPQLQAEYKANEDSLTTILPSVNQTILNATNAQTNFTNLTQLANTMDATTPTLATPILEKWLQSGQIELGSDAATNNFVSYLSTSLTEYAKVVTGQTSGAGVTDTANAQLQKLLSSGLTPSTIQSWITNVAQPAMQSRVSASIGQVSDISSTIGNLLSASASGILSGGATGSQNNNSAPSTDSSGAPSGWGWPTN